MMESSNQRDGAAENKGHQVKGNVAGETGGDSGLGENDVLLGRGLGTYNHVGNVRFRKLVSEHKREYVSLPKAEKPRVAKELVAQWRELQPPGRFLTKVPGEDSWVDVGDQRAREKTSQCLRERTPDILPFYEKQKRKKESFSGASLKKQLKVSAPAVASPKSPREAIQNYQREHQLRQLQAQIASPPLPLQVPPVPGHMMIQPNQSASLLSSSLISQLQPSPTVQLQPQQAQQHPGLSMVSSPYASHGLSDPSRVQPNHGAQLEQLLLLEQQRLWVTRQQMLQQLGPTQLSNCSSAQPGPQDAVIQQALRLSSTGQETAVPEPKESPRQP